MNDDNEKVVNLFSAQKKGKSSKASKACNHKQVCETDDGFSYITIRTDDNGRYFDEEKLLNNANDFYYIVKVMVKDGKHPYINNFKVDAEKLLEFIKMYIDGKGNGQIIEIDKFFNEEWA